MIITYIILYARYTSKTFGIVCFIIDIICFLQSNASFQIKTIKIKSKITQYEWENLYKEPRYYYWNPKKHWDKFGKTCMEIGEGIELITKWKPLTQRNLEARRRLKQKWLDKVHDDLKLVNVRNSEELAKNKERWRQCFSVAIRLKSL